MINWEFDPLIQHHTHVKIARKRRAWMVAKNKAGLYIVDPERKGGAPSKPKDARDNESQKAYYTRKYMEIHADRKKKGQTKAT